MHTCTQAHSPTIPIYNTTSVAHPPPPATRPPARFLPGSTTIFKSLATRASMLAQATTWTSVSMRVWLLDGALQYDKAVSETGSVVILGKARRMALIRKGTGSWTAAHHSKAAPAAGRSKEAVDSKPKLGRPPGRNAGRVRNGRRS